jgi:putative flippase GtrA
MKYFSFEFGRFIIIGCTNTLLTYLVYLGLLNVFDYTFAYSLAYVLGIIISYFLNVLIVFKEPVSLKSFVKFPFVYLVQYLLGLFLLLGLVELLGIDSRFAPFVIIMFLVPVTFFLSRYVIRGKN